MGLRQMQKLRARKPVALVSLRRSVKYGFGFFRFVFFDRLMRAEGYDLVLLRQAEAEA